MSALGAASFLLLLAAMLWVPWDRLRMPRWLQAALCSLATLLLGVMIYSVWVGSMLLPKECSGRRRWFCDLLNTLHAAGGQSAVGALFTLLTAVSLVATIRLLQQAIRESRLG
jgi:hypothetical protein